jgi:hypothetical protein
MMPPTLSRVTPIVILCLEMCVACLQHSCGAQLCPAAVCAAQAHKPVYAQAVQAVDADLPQGGGLDAGLEVAHRLLPHPLLQRHLRAAPCPECHLLNYTQRVLCWTRSTHLVRRHVACTVLEGGLGLHGNPEGQAP